VSFHRTPSGLSNLHLFYRVDAIVFVEGGDPRCSLSEILEGVHDTVSHDIRFWSIIFATYAPFRRFQFRAVGSKLNLLKLADHVVAHSISNVVLCVDRDSDDVTGEMRTTEPVLYTRGCSWENDVWNASTVADVFYDLSTLARDTVDVRPAAESAFERFLLSMKRVTEVHILLLQNGMDGLDRSTIRSALRTSKRLPPEIDRTHLHDMIRERCKSVQERVQTRQKRSAQPLADCDGHVLADFGYHLLAHLLRRYCKMTTIPKDLISAAALTRFERQVTRDPAIDGYYRPLMEEVGSQL
jgi:hypothetical protein